MNTQQEIGFGLSADDLEKILIECLKPEEINGDAAVQLDRIKELIRWFVRAADGNANPKWFRRHAFELVYYIATTAGNRFIDLPAVRKAGWVEGASMSHAERSFCIREGFIPTPSEQLFTREDMERAFFMGHKSFPDSFESFMQTNYPKQ